MTKKKVEVYGTGWCTKTANISNFLQSEWVDFEYFNVDLDEEAANRIREIYDGQLKFPIVIVDGKPHKNPDVKALRELLK